MNFNKMVVLYAWFKRLLEQMDNCMHACTVCIPRHSIFYIIIPFENFAIVSSACVSMRNISHTCKCSKLAWCWTQLD